MEAKQNAERLLHVIKSNPDYFLPIILELNNSLERSNLLPFLRARGRATLLLTGQDAITASALSNAWSSGWNDCIDTIQNFKEVYFPVQPTTPKMDFGGTQAAVTAGILTQEEADGLKRGVSKPLTNKSSPPLPKRPT